MDVSSLLSPAIEADLMKNIESGNSILTTIGIKMIKQQQSMDEQLINMLIVNQPQQVAPKSPNATFEFVA